jgi:DNA (cytosine-5)-methyltransferase 1
VGEGSPDLDTEPVFVARPIAGWDASTWDLASDLPLIDGETIPGTSLSAQEELWINAWDEFVSIMWEEREGRRLPGFPLWADEWVTTAELEIAIGTPRWKADFLRKNSEFYTAHQTTIDQWTQKWNIYSEVFPPSRRKLEWQAQDTPRLWDCVMHFRPSGIRAKRATYLPALVAITQTSIIGPRKRKLSTREAARLQGLPDWFSFEGQTDAATYRQLGNGVSVGVVWQVLKAHAIRDEDYLKKSAPDLLDAILSAPDSPDTVLSFAGVKENHG